MNLPTLPDMSGLMREIDDRRAGKPGGPGGTCGFDCDCQDSCLEFICRGKDGKSKGCGNEFSSNRAPDDWKCDDCGGKMVIW